uniref:Uncharacterized protein n=1 Tax=Nelumbo nucifera TaxID=4432 RepID=A0A822YA98_NELNU|nr:TPA_asm: hypothetical protein HUJ06_030968 [Nelumbo nucifera]
MRRSILLGKNNIIKALAKRKMARTYSSISYSDKVPSRSL